MQYRLAAEQMNSNFENLVPEHKGRLRQWVEEECWPVLSQVPNSHESFDAMWSDVTSEFWQQYASEAQLSLDSSTSSRRESWLEPPSTPKGSVTSSL